MVRRSAQVGIEKAPALGRGAAVWRFESHEYGINMLQDTRIVYLEDPAVERRIVHIEKPEICWLTAACLAVPPRLESGGCTIVALILKIKGVKN
jgi:hypothetical protein